MLHSKITQSKTLSKSNRHITKSRKRRSSYERFIQKQGARALGECARTRSSPLPNQALPFFNTLLMKMPLTTGHRAAYATRRRWCRVRQAKNSKRPALNSDVHVDLRSAQAKWISIRHPRRRTRVQSPHTWDGNLKRDQIEAVCRSDRTLAEPSPIAWRTHGCFKMFLRLRLFRTITLRLDQA